MYEHLKTHRSFYNCANLYDDDKELNRMYYYLVAAADVHLLSLSRN